MMLPFSTRLRPSPAMWIAPGMLALACAAAACWSAFAPGLPQHSRPFDAPAVYARWWAMTEACSGRSRDLASIRWYRVPGSAFRDGEQQRVGGAFNAHGRRIVLAQPELYDGPIVRHEMLHALLDGTTGGNGHPRAEFLGSCASLVVCQNVCLEDAGRWHASPGFVRLPPDSLDIESDAELLPRERGGQRWLSLWVIVRNPRSRPVLVAAPGDAPTPPSYGFDLRGPSGGISGGEMVTDSSTLFFQPFETKRWLFELLVASDLSEHHVTPGRLLVKGGYARAWAPFDTILVSQ